MNSSSVSVSTNDNITDINPEYECTICQNILTNPYEIITCNHIFCKKCIDLLFFYHTFQCPLCKITFSQKEIKENKKLKREISFKTTICKCSSAILLSNWNDHTVKCKLYLSEINSNIKRSILIVKEKEKDSNISTLNLNLNRSTFKCPVCNLTNFDRESLIKHVRNLHKNEKAVCPICLCQPWGDPNYKTHLLGHLTKRHKFDYDTTVDYNEEEDEVLKRVLNESMLNK